MLFLFKLWNRKRYKSRFLKHIERNLSNFFPTGFSTDFFFNCIEFSRSTIYLVLLIKF